MQSRLYLREPVTAEQRRRSEISLGLYQDVVGGLISLAIAENMIYYTAAMRVISVQRPPTLEEGSPVER